MLTAVDLAKEQKLNYGDDMTSVLRQARKRRFQLREEQRLAQDIELQTYLNQLILEDAENKLSILEESKSISELNNADEGSERNPMNETDSSEPLAASQALAIAKQNIENKKEVSLARLHDLFAKVDERRRVSNLSLFLFIFYWMTDVIYYMFFVVESRKEKCQIIYAEK